MSEHEIDLYLGGTPCICGDVTTWHPACYLGKTAKQIADAYRRVYARIRRKLYLERRAALKSVLPKGNPE